ncbi:MAG: 16S rRNA (adenine(1518)-N(6)/adenine(1519)-N(6))-dimethyltransferase RsmA [Spirochaetes bacterium]|nr:16S rRNA (adenine(1518)-N(6)/adenine(1519)-N(6))-dimethyltransferase RsmA [Spirochaetota bacterium]
MGPLNHDSSAEIRTVLERRGIGLKKRWGQNFLVNRGARERLVSLLDPRPGGLAWEIGPGLGAMTGLLLARGARVVAFEVDHGIARFLREEELAGFSGFTLVEGDFMRTWRVALDRHGPPEVVLGNLPYRSASLMIAEMVTGGLRPGRSVFTVQRELAERLTAAPGTKNFSSFSVLCGSCFRIVGRGDLQPGSFWPAPEVVSSVVELLPREGAPSGPELEMLSRVTRALFAARRKTIRNNAVAAFGPEVLTVLARQGIDPSGRAEDLAPQYFLGLARALTAAGPNAGFKPAGGP